MADNVQILDALGASRVIAARDDGTALHQRQQQTIAGVDVGPLNGLPVSGAAPNPITGTLSANGQAVQASMQGMGSVVFGIYGTYNLTVSFEACFDNGPTTWFPLLVSRLDTVLTATSAALTNNAFAYSSAADGGMTYIRMRCSAYTSGTANCIIAPGTMATEAAISAGVTSMSALVAGTAHVGKAGAPGTWQDTTSTPLAGSATFTGTARDLFVHNTAVNWTAATSYGAEYRISAEADVAGVLYLEVSRDNATFRRIKGVALAAFDGSSVLHGEIIHKPSWRYARPTFVNGAGAQGHFTLQETYLGLV